MMINHLRRLERGFFTLFPPACAGCEGRASPDQSFCPICAPTVHRLEPPYCGICMVPTRSLSPSDDTQSLCSRCNETPPAFDSVAALWEYDGAVADAIRRIKYGADFPALRALGRVVRPWFEEQLQSLPQEAPIFSIPAHATELRRRGYHLPTELLKLIAPKARDRLWPGLQKTRPTPAQAGLPFGARQKNMQGAFQWAVPRISAGGPAILFDDVLTTGATAAAAAKALKEAGFQTVNVVVLARALAAVEPARRSSMASVGYSR